MTHATEIRAHRVTLAKALDLMNDACDDQNPRKVTLFWGLAEREIDLIVALRTEELRHKYLQEA